MLTPPAQRTSSATVIAMLCAVASVLALTPLAAPSAAEELPALPADFEFGVAQSGFQSEGFNQDSNYPRYGNQGKLHEPVGNAVDFFHQYEGDVVRAAAIGVDNYRLSVEWSRIEPQPGMDDAAGWAFYDAVIGHIVASGMRPMITLNHRRSRWRPTARSPNITGCPPPTGRRANRHRAH
ncbi:family 1 glycosylhydrolase [Nocardia fluminea]|uniref:family 1 glycosylhydrolase n=1 Tax=Nocardia fluminea TaxID=134984 RepID=UPI0033CC4A4B